MSPSANSTLLEWSVRVRCDEHEIGGSLSVFIFLSNTVPPNPDEWLFERSFAGTFDLFTSSSYGQARGQASGEAYATNIAKGFIHINRKYLELTRQSSLEPEIVVPYLKQHLSWGADGKVVQLERFTSLEVTVLCTPLELPIGADYPIEGEPKVYPEITRGRLGGDKSGA
ncbi:Tyrosinase [Psilocybe cubensis]|uniref:Tyrosinase C-terminal domain-containing protein n=2 Tax=Psilocybe cubensis TaxID=181762 RepID=A0A8H7Y738_PSICU|nr:Tyrosinase [Psilocybe cubensis]KAH9484721.1 Tyrosinase [Psilocybe cubensis]